MSLIDRIKNMTFKVNFVSVYKFIRKYIFPEKHRKLGAIKDVEDHRDIVYKVRHYKALPVSTNRKNITEFKYRYDQGNIGSCVGHGVAEAFRRVLQVNGQPDFAPSRLFAYYIARQDKDNDTGASIRDAFKAINRQGLCSEKTVPYCTSRFARTPSCQAFAEALDHQSIRYERLPHTKEAIMDAVSQGYPVVYGKLVYDSFMAESIALSGDVPVPSKDENCHGGHCMVIFDYDEAGTVELNSWGSSWGNNGTCNVPWEYVLDKDLCMDFWVMYVVEG